MKPLSFTAIAAVVLASSALCQNQVTIPGHGRVYNGFSRGYNFTANTNFVITQLELPTDAMLAGDTAGFLVQVNGAPVLHSIGNTNAVLPLTSPILVVAGDVVDIIGNWSAVPPGNSTAHNSNGASPAPFATTIEGVAHTLNRCGWQWDIGDPLYTSGAYLAPTTGDIGRCWMYTAPAAGYAGWSTYGDGCGGGGPPGFYELFNAASPNDLTGLGFTQNATGAAYVVVAGANPIVTPSGAALTIRDDQVIQVTLPWAFPYQGGNVTNDLWVDSNGSIGLQTINSDYSESVGELLSGAPRVAAMWDDLNPSAAGTVHAEQDPTNAQLFHVTWTGVPEYSNTGANDFQITFHQGGTIEYKYGALTSQDNLVGFALGNGQADPGATDISAITALPTGDGTLSLALDHAANSRPIVGTTFNMEVSNLPSSSDLVVMVYGWAKSDPGISLAGLGMTGCFQFVSLETSQLYFPPLSATQPVSFAIPNLPILPGSEMYAQAAAVNVAANPLGVITSNGGQLNFDIN